MTNDTAATTPRSDFSALNLARAAVIAMLVLIMVSPPLANVAQAVLLALVVVVSDLRRRLLRVAGQPLVFVCLTFIAILLCAALYGIEPISTGLGALSGWRKILLLPIAVALFDDSRWKIRLLQAFIAAAVFFAVASSLLVAFGLSLPDKPSGIVVRNHSTQGLLFALAAFTAFVLGTEARIRFEANALRVAIVLLVFNIVVITPGKSGYLALVVFTAVGALYVMRRAAVWRRAALGGGAVLLMGLILALSPQSRTKIQQGIDEVVEYKREVEVSSMGQRVYFWRNTVDLIRMNPVLGVGTGGFEAAYREFVKGRVGMDGVVTGDPHNQYLKFAAEQGLVGLLIFFALLASAFFQRVEARFYALGVGALLVWSCTSLANAHFSTFVEGSVIFTWLGAMLARAPDGVDTSEASSNG